MTTTTEPTGELDATRSALHAILRGYDSLMVAYSGGVDSAYLAWEAHEVLGSRMLAVIADSPSLPRKELAAAVAFAEAHSIPLRILETHEMERPDGNFLHGVAVSDRGLFESVVDGNWTETVNAGDFAMAVAEVRSKASACISYGVAAGVNAHLFGLAQKKRLDERVHLFRFFRITGLEGEAGVREEAVGVVEVVIVDGQGEVFGGGGGLAAVATGNEKG